MVSCASVCDRTVYIDNFGENHPNVAKALNNSGYAWAEKGELDTAIKYFEKALVIDIKNFGEEHPSVAMGWYNLGVFNIMKSDYNKAIQYFEKSLAVRKKLYGKDHVYSVQTLENLEFAKAQLVK